MKSSNSQEEIRSIKKNCAGEL